MLSRGVHAEGPTVILDVFRGVKDLLQAVSSWTVSGEHLKHFCSSALLKESHLLTLGPHWNLNGIRWTHIKFHYCLSVNN